VLRIISGGDKLHRHEWYLATWMDVMKCYDEMNRKHFSDFSVMKRSREREVAAPQVGSSSLQQFLVHQQVKRKEHEPYKPDGSYCFVCVPE